MHPLLDVSGWNVISMLVGADLGAIACHGDTSCVERRGPLGRRAGPANDVQHQFAFLNHSSSA